MGRPQRPPKVPRKREIEVSSSDDSSDDEQPPLRKRGCEDRNHSLGVGENVQSNEQRIMVTEAKQAATARTPSASNTATITPSNQATQTREGTGARATVAAARATTEIDELLEEEEEEDPAVALARKRKMQRAKCRDFYVKELPDEKEEYLSKFEIQRNIAFCCAYCSCNAKTKRLVMDKETSGVLAASAHSLFHRRCCHDARNWGKKWKSPLEMALYCAQPTNDKLDSLDQSVSETTNVTYESIKNKYDQSKKEESEKYNNDKNVGQDSKLNQNEDYCENRKEFISLFKKRVKADSLPAAVVVNLFGGIGSAIVALKRLKIAIKHIIHVEHDKVAKHVYRWNHDDNYIPPGKEIETMKYSTKIKHEYYDSFEEFMQEMRQQKDLRIDIVIGSPNATDFSGINPQRRGVDGGEGAYMLDFGHYIQTLQQMQNHPVYFLASTTLLRQQRNKTLEREDRQRVMDAFDLTWSYDFDAIDVSPCRRRSTIFSNIPFEFTQIEKGYYASSVDCLEDGFVPAAQILQEGFVANSPCLLSSKSSLDTDRMLVYKEEVDYSSSTKTYKARYLRASEREKLMGLPSRYVTKSVTHLFQTLMADGFDLGLRGDKRGNPKDYWYYKLPDEYKEFSGNYHGFRENVRHLAHTFTSKPGQTISLQLAPPQTSTAKELVHYTEDQYAKRLIGNAFSIPVLEELLKPLQRIFANVSYGAKYDYDYEWCQPAPEPISM